MCILVLILLPFLRSPASRIAVWAVAAVIMVFVAYSRVALGVHWTSDVIAGVALGIVVVVGRRRGSRPGAGERAAGPPNRTWKASNPRRSEKVIRGSWRAMSKCRWISKA
ncbi:phosphatase PAP2 family protein [Streptosporangium vulgare]|uniref:phosphatase PAP2 family protein n=1 Tax=Streptosporangium vulgare TaxID=46190 RepID=UPI0031E2D63C